MSEHQAVDQIPSGFTLRHTLRGHSGAINQIAWSSDGCRLASTSNDKTIYLWDVQAGQPVQLLTGHSNAIYSIAWSPDGSLLASGSSDTTIRLWDTQTGRCVQTLVGSSRPVLTVAWSPDGKLLASGSDDKIIRLWDTMTGELLHNLTGHSSWVFNLAWSPSGKLLASASDDTTIILWDVRAGQPLRTLIGHSKAVFSVAWTSGELILASGSLDETVRVWDVQIGQQIRILEIHTDAVTSVSFSYNDLFLASKSVDGSVSIWRIRSWDPVAILDELASDHWAPGLAFHPQASILATLDERDTVIRIWDLDVDILLRTVLSVPSTHYTNAKVVLVGDSGVGKTGLSLVLSGKPFVATLSTHGRHVYLLDKQEIEERSGKIVETNEILLWDLAGQPNYRLIHQWHLNEVAVALIVFDASRETDSFTEIRYWNRALRLAQEVNGVAALHLKKFLVAARIDCSGRNISRSRIDTLVQELGFTSYIETSAKEGQGIAELSKAIREAIDWKNLPKVSSSILFRHIKDYLVVEKEEGRLLCTVDDLYNTFLHSRNAPHGSEQLLAQFRTCIGHLESSGLIRRLSFGDLVLLQPELLDAYASALINAIRSESDGSGRISEEKVLTCDFALSKEERTNNREQEKLLLIAMIADFIRYEIALREVVDDHWYLVFPSLATRDRPDLPDQAGEGAKIPFEGPVVNIYTTLAVRLSSTGLFKMQESWKNAITYTTQVGGMCGMILHNTGDGYGEVILFFDKTMDKETRLDFEEFVSAHLQRRALKGDLEQHHTFVCQRCGAIMTSQIVRLRRGQGFNWLNCPVCTEQISLLDARERLIAEPSSRVIEMDYRADWQRERETARSIVRGKVETEDFDVFLCHNDKNKAEVRRIGEQLQERGILPWFDEWQLQPGLPWQEVLEKQIKRIKAAAVFVGKDGIGPWQKLEIAAYLRKFVRRNCPVIPVLLADPSRKPKLPPFLENMTWVDFRKPTPDPMEQLIWGITGKRGFLKGA